MPICRGVSQIIKKYNWILLFNEEEQIIIVLNYVTES